MRELASAAADDELTAAEQLRLERHLGVCADCAAYAERIAVVTRQVRLRPVDVEHDFVARVIDRNVTTRRGRGAWLRPALAWCGLVIAAQSIRPLLFAELDGAQEHVARHVGASAMALAIGFLYAAWRPHRAAGMLPFAVALIVTTIAGTVFDTVSGTRTAIAELVHLAEFVGLVLLWMVAGSPGWERVSALARRVRGAELTTSS